LEQHGVQTEAPAGHDGQTQENSHDGTHPAGQARLSLFGFRGFLFLVKSGATHQAL
jgi:hypothetical protein